MSGIQLTDTELKCSLVSAMETKKVTDDLDSFVNAALLHEYDIADDELGDTITESHQLAWDVRTKTGLDIPAQEATSLTNGVSRCLQARFLGNCAISKHCTGRELVDSKLAELGITKYKGQAMEQAP